MLVILPRVEVPARLVAGLPNCGWLKILQPSTRKSSLSASVIGKVLRIAVSKFHPPRPSKGAIIEPSQSSVHLRRSDASGIRSNSARRDGFPAWFGLSFPVPPCQVRH